MANAYQSQQAYQQTLPYQQANQGQYGNSYSQPLAPQQAASNVRGRSSTEFAATEDLQQIFGPRAAEIINESHCKLENELIKTQKLFQIANEQLARANQTIAALTPHIQRYQSMERLMTDPDRLAKYTIGFFTDVYPVQSTREQQQQQLAVSQSNPYQRPNFPALPPAQGGGGQQLALASVRPEERWKVADQMERQGMFRTKQLIME
jgi:hypothetical protein